MFKVILFLLVTLSLEAKDEITPIPIDLEYNEKKAQLGKKLFSDSILSKDGTISCASCHILPKSGTTPTAHSFGINAIEGSLNSPTVLNARLNFIQTWEGRAKDLHAQALLPLLNPIEMGNSQTNLLQTLQNSPYQNQFVLLYKDGVSINNLVDALAEFEKALTTPNSRFDKYLRGDGDILSEKEKRGYARFKDIGCVSCHNGVNIGGNMFQKIGTLFPYIEPNGKKIEGRYNVTHRERDKQVFKVPSLRNIALTAPYFHNGSVQTLRDAILKMRRHQLGIFEDSQEVDEIEAFLRTLTGEQPRILRGDK